MQIKVLIAEAVTRDITSEEQEQEFIDTYPTLAGVLSHIYQEEFEADMEELTAVNAPSNGTVH